MKIKTNQKNEAARNALRNVLIQKIDAALEANAPDMEYVDLCTKLLDALEQGSCQPRGRRMRQELARIAQEIDYIPQAHTMVLTKPMTVRRVLVGAAAVVLCLLLLPISVMLLRGGNPTLSGQETTEASSVTAETAEPAVTAGCVTFLRGNRVAQYDSLADCLDLEMPEVYYPAEFPADMQPESVTVTDAEDGIHTEIRFRDSRYSITIRPWTLSWKDTAMKNGCQEIAVRSIMGSDAYWTMRAFRKSDDDGFYLKVHTDSNDPNIYEFRVADEETAYSLLVSMRRADTDHIHAWNYEIVNDILDGKNKKVIQKYCSLCPFGNRPVQILNADIEQKEFQIAAMEKEVAAAQERMKLMTESLESAADDQDKTNISKNIAFMEEELSELEEKIQFLKDAIQAEIAEREYIFSHFIEFAEESRDG